MKTLPCVRTSRSLKGLGSESISRVLRLWRRVVDVESRSLPSSRERGNVTMANAPKKLVFWLICVLYEMFELFEILFRYFLSELWWAGPRKKTSYSWGKWLLKGFFNSKLEAEKEAMYGKLLPKIWMAINIFFIMSVREVFETDLPWFKEDIKRKMPKN